MTNREVYSENPLTVGDSRRQLFEGSDDVELAEVLRCRFRGTAPEVESDVPPHLGT